MIIDKFIFESKQYVIEFQDDNSIVFYREEADRFCWFSDPILVTRVMNDIRHPSTLLRKVARKVSAFLYKNKIKYFYFTVNDKRLRKILMRFTGWLSGYEYQLSEVTINVFKFDTLNLNYSAKNESFKEGVQ